MKKIIIIGAGFSGVMTAVHLLKSLTTETTEVLLLNRSGKMARGLAYGTQSADHTLNVPCGNMSTFPEDPLNFLRFAQTIDSNYGAGSFVSRSIYGDYLESLLTEAELTAQHNVTLKRVVGEAARIEFEYDGGSLWLADDRCYKWNRLVLAFGHFPSSNPHVAQDTFYSSTRYIRDPWDVKEFSKIPAESSVLLLGTGLTAVDTSISLLKQNSTREITAVSRRGLVPQPHRHTANKPQAYDSLESLVGGVNTIRSRFRFFREKVTELKKVGGDWRDILAALRPYTAQIWRAMPPQERRQFLRHLQPYWDSHRHRLAAVVHDQFEAAKQAGAVRTFAGRIIAFEEKHDCVDVHIRQRNSSDVVVLNVQYVVNCTGPASNLKRVDSQLVKQLIAEKRIKPDNLGLGLHVAPNGAVVNENGEPSRSLYYVGPLLKADYWEATAVPELRQYAENLAKNLLI